MAKRHLTRLDPDIYEAFREQAHVLGTDSTALINTMLRYALPLAAAGVFDLPHETILAALQQYRPEPLAPLPQFERPAPTGGRRALANPFETVTGRR